MTTWTTEKVSGTVSTGTTTVGSISSGLIDVDNLRLDGNTISTTDTDGNILITPNGSGKVGIGTTSPQHNLTVESSTGDAWISINPASGDFNSGILFLDPNSSIVGAVGYDDGNNTISMTVGTGLNTDDGIHMTRDTKCVGIGTRTPTQDLHITGASSTDVRHEASSGDCYMTQIAIDPNNTVQYRCKLDVVDDGGYWWSMGQMGIIQETLL